MADASLDETIRFCGKSSVLMEMTYNGISRLVEVYSYRSTKSGEQLLFAWCGKDQKIESFRVDRIEHAKAASVDDPDNPGNKKLMLFTPRYAIEIQ